MIFRRGFTDSGTSVIEARHFTASVLEGMPDPFVDAVVLMVSELATNAVQHARSRFEIVIDCDPAVVVVDVFDHGSGEAAPQTPRVTDVSGRGLQIVRALADTWGVRPPSDDWRKAVWFTLRVPGVSVESETG
jgi:anti-sigma regulatory factor (Ser/Thr protein kinase)